MTAWYELKVAGYSVGMTQSLGEVVDWYHRATHDNRCILKIDGSEKRTITVDVARSAQAEQARPA